MKGLLTTIRRTLQLLGPGRRWRWAILVGLALAVAGFEAVGALLIFTLLELVAEPDAGVTVPLLDVPRTIADSDTVVLGVAIFVAAFFIVRGFVLVGQAYIQSRLVHSAAAQLSAHLLRGYLAMPYLFHTRRNSAELVRNTFDSVIALAKHVLVPLAKIVAETVLVIGLLVVLLWASPLATLLATVVLGPLILVLVRVVHPRLKRLGRVAQDAKKGSLKSVQQALGGLRDIRILGKERYFSRTFADERRRLAQTQYVHNAIGELPRALIETSLVLVVVMLFMIAVLGGDTLEGLLPTLGVFAYAGLRLQPSLREIVKSLNDVRFGSAVLDDLHEDRERVDAALSDERRRRTSVVPSANFSDRMELRDVGFHYDPQQPRVLTEIDLVVTKGEFLGVCGPTGGGKSTLVDLILGLLPPSHGEILVDGWNLAEVTPWWQTQIGMVSQSVFLIDDSIRNNIALGCRPEEIDDERLWLSVQRAQLSDVIASLPRGLDTLVGERGIRLSGGQRQRVAIARALYREPSVLIFDEGTSALDNATEAALVREVDRLRGDRTLIAVAHRLSTVQRADRIIVIESGRLVAVGTYEELLKASSSFRSLAQ